MRRKKIPSTGSVFLVPLQSGGYAIGVLVRADGRGRAYGLFFGPRLMLVDSLPVSSLNPEQAILHCRFGDHALHSGRWPVIGRISEWDSWKWPVPKFSRRHDCLKKCYITEYDDDLNVISEAVASVSEGRDFPEDAQLGSGVVESKLDKILN